MIYWISQCLMFILFFSQLITKLHSFKQIHSWFLQPLTTHQPNWLVYFSLTIVFVISLCVTTLLISYPDKLSSSTSSLNPSNPWPIARVFFTYAQLGLAQSHINSLILLTIDGSILVLIALAHIHPIFKCQIGLKFRFVQLATSTAQSLVLQHQKFT